MGIMATSDLPKLFKHAPTDQTMGILSSFSSLIEGSVAAPNPFSVLATSLALRFAVLEW